MEARKLMLMSDLERKLLPVIRELDNSSGHIAAIAIISKDGLCITSTIHDVDESDRFSAMASSTLSLAETTCLTLRQGRLKQVLVEGEDGYILTVDAGEAAVLSIVARKSVNLGMLFLEARQTVKKIVELMS